MLERHRDPCRAKIGECRFQIGECRTRAADSRLKTLAPTTHNSRLSLFDRFFRNSAADQLKRRMDAIRKRVRPEPYDWYQFNSFANLTQFEQILDDGFETALELAADEPVADLGAGDGDVSFLFESRGCHVTAMDWPGTNENRMRGMRLLKQELGSSIGIRPVEFDDHFRLDGERYGLVLALGLLYHLKNPYYFVERIARHGRYCILSTRVLADSKLGPVAELVREREFLNDPTNFWFFSEAGIRRLLDRCGWDIIRENITGDGVDNRFFCVAESRIAKTQPTIRLVSGWHPIENNAWRWTGAESVSVVENTPGADRFEFKFHVTPGRLVTIEAEVNGQTLPQRQFRSGDHTYSESIAPAGDRNMVRIRIGGTVRDEADRELGVVVALPLSTVLDEESGIRLLGGTRPTSSEPNQL